MSQITLRQVPEHLERQIRQLAAENKTSINKTIIYLLHKCLCIPENGKKKRDLHDLFGSWGAAEAQLFEENTKMFEEIDSELWAE
jgi:hypothetical protein